MDTDAKLRYLELTQTFSEDQLQRLPFEIRLYRDDYEGMLADYYRGDSPLSFVPVERSTELIEELRSKMLLLSGLELERPKLWDRIFARRAWILRKSKLELELAADSARIYSEILAEYRFMSNVQELREILYSASTEITRNRLIELGESTRQLDESSEGIRSLFAASRNQLTKSFGSLEALYSSTEVFIDRVTAEAQEIVDAEGAVAA